MIFSIIIDSDNLDVKMDNETIDGNAERKNYNYLITRAKKYKKLDQEIQKQSTPLSRTKSS